MSREEILKRAEQFVRETFENDLKQPLNEQKIKEIAMKVARSVPRRAA